MARVPGASNIAGEGLRQKRAAQLKAEMEARRRETQPPPQSGTATEAASAAAVQSGSPGPAGQTPAAESPAAEPDQSYRTGPVGTGEYEVKQGECISSIAKDTGHFWKTLWNDPENAELKEVRKDPNVLLPGDRVHLPALRLKQEPGETEMRHRFVRRGEPGKLCLQILGHAGPRASEPYSLVIDGITHEGMTDIRGCLQVPIPGNARTARLYIGAGREDYAISLGDVDPITEVTGVQQRLANLGFPCGAVDGIVGPKTRLALREFQRQHQLPQTGEPDQVTRDKLRNTHGC